MSEQKTSGRSGKHAGERILVTLDSAIYKKLSDIAELEGLPLATKARQVLTMFANGIVPYQQQPPTNKTVLENKNEENSNGTLNIFDDQSWENN